MTGARKFKTLWGTEMFVELAGAGPHHQAVTICEGDPEQGVAVAMVEVRPAEALLLAEALIAVARGALSE